jgi:hypothetical protein
VHRPGDRRHAKIGTAAAEKEEEVIAATDRGIAEPRFNFSTGGTKYALP